MCGIAGIISRNRDANPQRLETMIASLVHRGPDGTGRAQIGRTAIGHTRLAIIDLETGDQPLIDTNGAQLVANGEIYNFVELRADLGEASFATKSDCEPPLKLFAASGTDYAAGLRGMYAIAVVEENGETVHLSRDPFGIKPLYYTAFEGGVAFASEPQALIAGGFVAPVVQPAARAELLQHQFTTGPATIFEGIRRVLPGETISLTDKGVTPAGRLAALPAEPPAEWREEHALELLNEALMNSVAVHQRSDVPYGMFLSGGVDSSALLACMRDLNERPVECFTAGFSGTGVSDERAHASHVAKAAGAHFHAVEFSEDDFWSLLPELAWALDDPTADYAVLPIYKLGAEVKKHGLKVVLSGEGGDELFAGYGRYRRLLRPWFLGGRPMRKKGLFDGLDVLRPGVGSSSAVEESGNSTPAPGWTKLQAAQAVDCAGWLPNDLLIKLDRCLMAHGVEGRTPFLDPEVAKIAMFLPDRLKIRNGQGKYLLRKWLDQHLPEADPFSKKRGFTVPVAEWIAGQARTAGELVAAQDSIREIADPDKVLALFTSLENNSSRHAGQAAWTLLFYALWHQCHIEGKKPDGGVFDVLG